MKTGKLNIKDQLFVLFWEFKVFLKPRKYNSKVFCIGFNKTGTTALGQSLRLLGYDHSTFNRKLWREHYKNGNTKAILNYTAKFESFDDLPWLKEDMIPILDKTFPNSRFIYLDRDEDSWKKSIEKWTNKVSGRKVNPEVQFEAFKTHRAFVLDYFSDKDDQLIRLEINDPTGFEKLANFLGKKAPQKHFKEYNKT